METKPGWQEYARALQENGQTVFVKQSVPLEVYYGIANSLLTEAGMCRKKQDLPELYTVLLRLANLRADGIPTHQDYDSAHYSHQRAYFRKLLLNDVLPELEHLKPELQRRMEQLKKLDCLHQIKALSRIPVSFPFPSEMPARGSVYPPTRPPESCGLPASPRDNPCDRLRDCSRALVPFRTPRDSTTGYPHPPFQTPSVASGGLPLGASPLSETSTSSSSENSWAESPAAQTSLPAHGKTTSCRSFEPTTPRCPGQRHIHEDFPQKAPTENERLKTELRLSIPEHKEENYGRHLAPPWDPYALLPMPEESVEFESPSRHKRGLTVPDSRQFAPIAPAGLNIKGRVTKGLDMNRNLSTAGKPARCTDELTSSNKTNSRALEGWFETPCSVLSEGYGSSDDDVSAASVKRPFSGVEGITGFEGSVGVTGLSAVEGLSRVEELPGFEGLPRVAGLSAEEGQSVSEELPRVEELFEVEEFCGFGSEPDRWYVPQPSRQASSKSALAGPLFTDPIKVNPPITPRERNYIGETTLEDEEEKTATASDQRMSQSLRDEHERERTDELGIQQQQLEWQTIQCSICFEDCPSRHCVRACIDSRRDDTAQEKAQGLAAALDAGERVLCCHWHCRNCLRQYASLKVLESRTSRIVCTSTDCPGEFLFEDLEWMLGKEERDVYTALLAEDMMECKVYCPFDDCDTIMEYGKDEPGPDSMCVVCRREFCRVCCVPWHFGKTCAEYESVKEDGPLHELANKHKWMSCPKCNHMIERRDGCNFVQCKCGCGFCYQCGTPYIPFTASATNAHGDPGCECHLY